MSVEEKLRRGGGGEVRETVAVTAQTHKQNKPGSFGRYDCPLARPSRARCAAGPKSISWPLPYRSSADWEGDSSLGGGMLLYSSAVYIPRIPVSSMYVL